jgi:hypothetical protein
MKLASIINCAMLLIVYRTGWGEEIASPPVRFASSGQVITVRLPDAGNDPVRLRALGRNLHDPLLPRDGAIQVELPEVRVPTAFSVVSAEKTEPELGRIVVYPRDYHLPWDKQVPLSFDAESPTWFKEWMAVTGLPAAPAKLGDFPVGDVRLTGGAGLLVVGSSGAGKSSSEFVDRHTHWQINVLVLEADWFGESLNEEVRVPRAPEGFHHGLAELNRYHWPQSLSFRGTAGPWPGIANRWVWIDGPKAPLVEEFRAATNSQRIVFSYLPWSRQLGIETADSIFLSLLKEAARKRATDGPLDREFNFVWPPEETVSATKRPVLAECLRERQLRRDTSHSQPKGTSPDLVLRKAPLSILDLRGPALATSDAEALPVISRERDWLILGTDAGVTIPEAEQAKHYDEQRPESKPKVIHLVDDALPSPSSGNVRLMQILTDQGIFIGNFKIVRSNP